MKIEMNTIYHLPTRAHEDDFLKQAEKQGLLWLGRLGNATCFKPWRNANSCIRVNDNRLAGYDIKSFYERKCLHLPIIEWKIGFSKADMQIGQVYKVKGDMVYQWSKTDIDYYSNDLTVKGCDSAHANNIIEVYPFPPITVWKREEPKYRVKTELTKEQAEKLGLEFCEEVTE